MLHELTLAGERFAVRDEGRGPPLLLVHGFPFDRTMWDAVLPALTPHARVLAPDLRGFGRSVVSDGSVSMARMADDLAAVLDALHVTDPLIYVGFSMGGYVGWPFLERHGRRVSALAAVDTRAAADTPEAAAGRLTMADRVLAAGSAVAADAMLPRLLAPDRARRDPDLVRRVRELMLRADPRGIAAAQRGMAARPDSRALLATLRLPTLMICGEHDVISTRDEMRALAATVPGSRFVEVRDAGHLTPVEQPGAVSGAILEFVASGRPPAH